MEYQNSLEFARRMDSEDPIKEYRDHFHIPQKDGKDCIYFTGNSLGLQPKSVSNYLNEELQSWKDLAVEGHFQGIRPWLYYHRLFKEPTFIFYWHPFTVPGKSDTRS